MVSAMEPSSPNTEQSFKKLVKPITGYAKILARTHHNNNYLPMPIIAIAGCTGIGKSHFTKQLVKLLRTKFLKTKHMNVAILKEDDFLQPELVKNPVTHPHFDNSRAHDVIQQIIANGEHVRKPVWDHSEAISCKEEIVACFHDVDLVLFEGIYALCDENTYDFLHYSSLRIFLEAEEKDIIEWNWQRELECPKKARSREKFDGDVAWDMEDHRKVVAPTKKDADFIIHKDANHNYSLEWDDAKANRLIERISNRPFYLVKSFL